MSSVSLPEWLVRALSALRKLFASPIPFQLRALHLFALCGIAVAQPLLGLLGSEPGFWIARGATYFDVITLLLVVVVVLPGSALGLQWLIAKGSERLAWIVHIVTVAGLIGLVAINVIDTVTGGTVAPKTILAFAVAFTVLLAAGYLRFNALREFTSLLAIGPIVFGALFMFQLPALGGTDAAAVDVGLTSSDTVVLLILDEFQLAAIQNEDGTIDRTRFPNMGRLADMSTWYPNATTVHDNSLRAVPAVLTGMHPEPDQLATAEEHPLSIFTVLANTHDMRVNEDFTQVCPTTICEESRPQEPTTQRLSKLAGDSAVVYLHSIIPDRLRYRLPDIGTRWEGFLTTEVVGETSEIDIADEAGSFEREYAELSGSEWRAVDFGVFLDSLDPELGPTLHYLHVDLPHAPWSYLPSGRRYPYSDTIPGYTPEGFWRDDPWYTQLAYQRFLLNSAFTDALVGRMLDVLEQRRMLDEVILVVASDHGENFAVNESRRAITNDSLAATAGMPLFIKYPGQTEAVVDRRSAQTIDVLPTIVDVLGGSVDRFDGVSLLMDDPPVMKEINTNAGAQFILSVEEYEVAAAAFRSEIVSVLPAGVGLEGIFAVAGPRSDLNGRSLSQFDITEQSGAVDIASRDFFANYDPESHFEPIAIPAEVTVDDRAFPDFYAIAVNGTIQATISAHTVDGDTATLYTIIPPGTYQPGRNEVEVLGISGSGDGTALVRYVEEG